MNVDAYLDRIQHDGSRDPTAGTLAALHRAHMLTVPFETLDIPLGRPLSLSLPALYDKIVVRRRGGFCYELNGLFAWLLREIGFDLTMLAARVYGDGGLGPERDHLLLLVHLDDEWIADVGFGDSFLTPFRVRETDHVEGRRTYRIAAIDEQVQLQRREDTDWVPQYLFTLEPRVLGDFIEMCRYQQTSPLSSFVGRSICSLATPRGRTTLSNRHLIVTQDDDKEERPIADETDYRHVLKTTFGIELTEDIAPLMSH